MRQCESAQYNQKVPGPEIGNLLSRDSRWNKKSERCRLESEPRTPHPTCNVEPPAGSVDRRRSDLFIPFAGPLGRANSTLQSGDRGDREAPHALTFYSIYCTRVGVSSLCKWARVAGGDGEGGDIRPVKDSLGGAFGLFSCAMFLRSGPRELDRHASTWGCSRPAAPTPEAYLTERGRLTAKHLAYSPRRSIAISTNKVLLRPSCTGAGCLPNSAPTPDSDAQCGLTLRAWSGSSVPKSAHTRLRQRKRSSPNKALAPYSEASRRLHMN